jgi:type III pantothenate kinase
METSMLRTAGACARALRSLSGEIRSVRCSAICSVVPLPAESLAIAIERIHGRAPFMITHEARFPLRNCYDVPGQVGLDRLASACGGFTLRGAPLIVVDAGTAVTIDVVSCNREFLGGAILPGIGMGADALARYTAKLPRVELEPPARAIGRTTDENIRAGLFLGAAGAVDAVIRRCWKELGYRTPVIATGGSASAIAASSQLVRRIEPELTLLGIKSIHDLNTR